MQTKETHINMLLKLPWGLPWTVFPTNLLSIQTWPTQTPFPYTVFICILIAHTWTLAQNNKRTQLDTSFEAIAQYLQSGLAKYYFSKLLFMCFFKSCFCYLILLWLPCLFCPFANCTLLPLFDLVLSGFVF